MNIFPTWMFGEYDEISLKMIAQLQREMLEGKDSMNELAAREKELVDASRELKKWARWDGGHSVTKRFLDALSAYGPERAPLIPAWRELTDKQREEIRQSTEGSPVVTYNAIRRITAIS